MFKPSKVLFSLATQDKQASPSKSKLYPDSNKILSDNKFLCFQCNGDNQIVINCQVCSSKGYICGNHPMVELIEKIIELKIHKQQQEVPQQIQKKQSTGQISVHRNYICDGCQMDPIEGIRYNCKQCNDYDLCQKCYNLKLHKHSRFQKIGRNGNHQLSHSPAKIKLSKAFQKQKLLKNVKSCFSKIK